jgi:hypothetical protein
MSRYAAAVLAALGSVVLTTPASMQAPVLSVVGAGPTGELAQPGDASEIRVVFSDPMVAVGGRDLAVAPAWFTIEPALAGTFYWSGTRTLIITPDPDAPLPRSTRYVVHIATSAASLDGRTMPAPHEFAFTTPTVRLTSADWYRRDGRYDAPALLALKFNQPVRPADVAAHASVRYEPHPWTPPVMSLAARDRLAASDPGGLARFDAKVAAAQRAASSSELVPVRLAASWDEERYPPSPDLVVLETRVAPATDGWLSVTLDEQLPALEGVAEHPVQQTVVKLEPTFFAALASRWVGIALRRPARLEDVTRAVTVTAVEPGGEAIVPRTSVGPTNATRPDYSLSGLGFPAPPWMSTWFVSLDPSLESADGQVLGYPWLEVIEAGHAGVALSIEGRTWEARNGPRLPLLALNVTAASESLARLSVQDILPALRAAESGRGSPSPSPGMVRAIPVTPDRRQVHQIDLQSYLSPGGTGVVGLAIRATGVIPGSRPGPWGSTRPGESVVVQVTNLGLTVKSGVDRIVAFVRDLDTTEPVADAAVTVIDADTRVVWSARTDARGVAEGPAIPSMRESMVTAEKDGDLAFVTLRDGLSDGRTSSSELPLGWLAGIFTDRAVYRKGEQVTLKAIVRAESPDGPVFLNPTAAVSAEIRNDRGAVVDRRTFTAGEWSSVGWTWQVPADARLGHYFVQVGEMITSAQQTRIAGGWTDFLVAAFRAPDFTVETAAPAALVLGETLHASIEGRYLFGSPLAGQPVRWSFRPQRLTAPDAITAAYPSARFAFGYSRFDSSDSGAPAESRGAGVLDGDGRLSVDLATRPTSDALWRYWFNAEVASVSAQYVADRRAVLVHPADVYGGIEYDTRFFDQATGADVRVHAVAPDGTARSRVPIHLQLFREEPVSDRAWLSGARDRLREIPAGDWTIVAAAGGTPLHVPLPVAGAYVLRAFATDAAGRRSRTDWSFYATGPARAWQVWDSRTIDLVPERQTWRPGETARILVKSPWPSATAIVSVEREGVRRHSEVALRGRAATIDVPITESDAPNVFVSVVLIKGRTDDVESDADPDPGRPAVRIGQTELTVDSSLRRLAVSLAADQAQYRPGDRAAVEVAVRDASGAPVRSEVTLWAVDRGVLSLTDYSTPDLVKSMYARRPSRVSTRDNRLFVIARRPGGPQALWVTTQALGGGGRPASAVTFNRNVLDVVQVRNGDDQPDGVRRDFRPLAFWLGSVETGEDGRAAASAALPDLLTTFRIMAVAADRQSRFGSAEHEIRVTRPLAMLPAFPRFLARGDRGAFGVSVTSGPAGAGDVVVTIRSLDPGVLAFQSTTRTVRIGAGDTVPISFDATAMGRGTARVRVTASLAGETDAFDWSLPVVEPLHRVVSAAYGDTIDRATERIALPSGAVAGSGLTVDLASTAMVGLGGGAQYLVDYPYGCAEQQASRVLALLFDAEVDGAFRLSSADATERRRRAAEAVDRLFDFQCAQNGGFSLWPGQCGGTSAYLTAYVLHVLHVAGRRSASQDYRLESALNYLEQQLRAPPPEVQHWLAWAASEAYAVKVLSEFGRTPAAAIDRLVAAVDRMPVFALSFLADALSAAGDRGPRYREVLRRMSNAMRVEADRAFVQEMEAPSLLWLWNSNVRTTGVVLEGVARRGDDPRLAAPMARWLLSVRENGRWGTTHENAAALEALVQYFRALEPDEPQMTATATLGSQPIGRATFNGRSDAARSYRLDLADLVQASTPAGATDLTFAKAGAGRLYYSARLDYLEPVPAGAASHGMRIERQFEQFVPDGVGPVSSSFARGDVVRVRLVLTLPREGRFLAVTDALPSGFEPIDASFRTTASDLAREATTQSAGGTGLRWWRDGGFDHVEKHDDRVVAFATRLAPGRHEFTYLVRATTVGTFTAAGAAAEAMYAPEVSGRSATTTVTVR